MATIKQQISAQTNTNWWTTPVNSHQTHIVISNEVFVLLGNQERAIKLRLQKDDFLKAAANILYSLPLNKKSSNGSILLTRSYDVIKNLIFSIDKFFGDQYEKDYNVELSEETQNRKIIKSLNDDGFNLRDFLVDGHSTLVFSNDNDIYSLKLESEKVCEQIQTNAPNMILYGPPGTGKTFAMQEEFSKYPEDNRSIITFHQSYSYEEFIIGLKAKTTEDNRIEYSYEKGVFYNACERAAVLAGYSSLAECCSDTKESRNAKFAAIAGDTSRQFLFCIDEINRANISAVFGDLISLIEENKRLGAQNEMIVRLPYTQELFGVPANLRLLGTMNTADRSIQILDTALRRRFQFKEYLPDYDVLRNEKAKTILQAINDRIRALLGQDRQIGHSYFYDIEASAADESTRILKALANKIIPLLQEYFYNDVEKIRFVLGEKDRIPDEHSFYIEDGDATAAFSRYDSDSEETSFYILNTEGIESASMSNESASAFIDHITA